MFLNFRNEITFNVLILHVSVCAFPAQLNSFFSRNGLHDDNDDEEEAENEDEDEDHQHGWS